MTFRLLSRCLQRPLPCLVVILTIIASPVLAQSGNPAWESREFRDWTLACPVESEQPGARGCLLTQSLTLDDGRRLMAIQLSAPLAEQGTDSSYAVVLSTPLNVYLPAGARVRIDESASLRIGYERCDTAGCYAGTLLSDNLDKYGQISVPAEGEKSAKELMAERGQDKKSGKVGEI